ncbi:MAG: hypothetical protein M3077_10020 [Candidatus Dormibacteraeota bacterium]|nr:hypothetical protein [Candidatus Dormibacteraeota bacterium]
MPEGFEAYGRVLHPASRETERGFEPVRWSMIASWTGRTVHPLMQFHRIANLPIFPGHRPTWGFVPSEGEMPSAEGERLVGILRAHTATLDRCYLGLWEGYGVPELNAFAKLPRLMLPHRAYFLFLGSIDAVTSMSIGGFQHPPNLWWPEDRAWCVASKIDLSETYLAASEACVTQVTNDPGLEAYPVPLEGRVDVDGDLINRYRPQPDRGARGRLR